MGTEDRGGFMSLHAKMLLSSLTAGGRNWNLSPSFVALWHLWEDLWISEGF